MSGHTYTHTYAQDRYDKNTTSVYPCRSCEIPRARKYGKDAGLSPTVARTCDNEVGVAISIRDPYTSPFTRRCK